MDKKMVLPDDVVEIITTLEQKGFEAYAVGGCVRDAMLGRVPEDWDITTSAKPLEIKNCFTRTIDTGIQHGTVTVMKGKVGYEVTTYRIDGEYEDGRHPKKVEFTTNLKRDLERRDFTINAMAYNEKIGLVDEFGGLEDLKNGIIRCVGDPNLRFDEDALRMLRAVRFSGQLSFQIEEKTREAIRIKSSDLKKISAERIRTEITKLLISGNASRFREAYTLGMTDVFLPEFNRMMETEQYNPHHIYTVGEHSLYAVTMLNCFFGLGEQKYMDFLMQYMGKEHGEKVISWCRGLSKKQHQILSLTMLLHDIAKPECMKKDENGIGHFYGHPEIGEKVAKKIMKRLKYDNETISTVGRLIRNHDNRCEPTEKSVRRLASKIGSDVMLMLFVVQYVDALSQNPDTITDKLARIHQVWQIYQEIMEKEQALSIKDLKVDGGDLMKLGVPAGPHLGELLQYLLECVLENPEYNEKEQLIKLIEKKEKI